MNILAFAQGCARVNRLGFASGFAMGVLPEHLLPGHLNGVLPGHLDGSFFAWYI